MTKKILIVCLDSFRFDYLDKTRFLKGLAKRHKFGKLETILGFDGIGASLLTGKYPQEHGVFTKFWYDPKNSPFGLLERFAFLEGTVLEWWVRKAGELLFLLRQYLRGGFMAKIHKIPLSRIGDFNVSARKAFTEPGVFGKIRTIPDILREKGVEFIFFDWPVRMGSKGRTVDFCRNRDRDKVNSLLRQKDRAQFSWLRLWDLDTAVHKFGIDSAQARKVLAKLDRLCERLIEGLGGESQVEFLFWSDHGMVKVKKTIDVEALFGDMKVKMFLDSTLARFWGVKGKEKEILKRLSRLPGKVLGEKEKAKFKIDFGHEKYGEIIFLADPGVLIWPNYFEGKARYKAMHGYDPECLEQKGIYISSSGLRHPSTGFRIKAQAKGRGRQDKQMTEMFGEIKRLITDNL